MTNGLFVLNPAEALKVDSTNRIAINPLAERIVTSPNPAAESFTFQVNNSMTGLAAMSLVNMDGMIVRSWNQQLTAGTHVKVETLDLAGGNYIFTIKSKEHSYSARINISR